MKPSDAPDPSDFFQWYMDEIARTAGSEDLGMFALGLAGEAGELVDAVKKFLYHGANREMARLKIKREAGDVLWYLCGMLAYLDIDPVDVIKLNVAKLRDRYPNGFEKNKDRV